MRSRRGAAQARVEEADAATNEPFAFRGKMVALQVFFRQVMDEQVDVSIVELGGDQKPGPLVPE